MTPVEDPMPLDALMGAVDEAVRDAQEKEATRDQEKERHDRALAEAKRIYDATVGAARDRYEATQRAHASAVADADSLRHQLHERLGKTIGIGTGRTRVGG